VQISRALRIGRFVRAVHAGYAAARVPQPPPAPHFGTGAAARASRVALAAGGVALLLLALDLPAALPSSWVASFRVGTAAVLLPVGLWLTLRARRKHAVRAWGARMRERLLELGGVVMVAVGAVELALGLHHLL